MEKDSKLTRRNMLKLGAALATIPVVAIAGEAWAAQNAALRSALKYQDKPGKDGQKCSTCTHWVPGKTATAKGPARSSRTTTRSARKVGASGGSRRRRNKALAGLVSGELESRGCNT